VKLRNQRLGLQRLLVSAANELRQARLEDRNMNFDRVRLGYMPEFRPTERLKQARRAYAMICERFVEAA